jgi:hypothetical protein
MTHDAHQELIIIHENVLTDGATVIIDTGEAEFVVLDRERNPDNVDGLTTVCRHCLLTEQPDLKQGLDTARQTGQAQLIDGEWMAVVG